MIILESERLLIRPLSISELSHIKNDEAELLKISILSNSVSDAVITAITKKIANLKIVETAFHEWYTYWLIIDKNSGNGIGFEGFKGIDKDGFAEVGYSISSDFRNKGLMTEALKALIKWADKNIKLKGVKATVNKTNIESIKVLKNCGFSVISSSERDFFYCLKLK